jgi:hypothetical protein
MMAKPYLSMFGLRQDIVNLTGLFFLSCPFSSKLFSESSSQYISFSNQTLEIIVFITY